VVLVIDNYDSFTYNLVQYLWELGAEVVVRRNDEVTLAQIDAHQPRRVLLSPGPCTPKEAGICIDAIRHFAGKLPIFGVCLGHQAIGAAFGGNVVRAKTLMHGKTSTIEHDGKSIFRDLPSPFAATRYHSLVVDEPTLPDALQATAHAKDADGNRVLMGLRHKSLPIEACNSIPKAC
jgi:anthranilate synthase/aminodeoxychorismate synthase-like glutamine amidotransferase